MSNPLNDQAESILREIAELSTNASNSTLSKNHRRQLLAKLARLKDALDELNSQVDEVEMPDAFFDPSEPSLIGSFIALVLTSRPRIKMETLSPFYGAGVYAIYYIGELDIYEPIKGSETPIYVGKADPKGNPKTPREQELKLFNRLKEHRKTIEKVEGLKPKDFEVRYLAVQSGFQSAAESHLIKLFQPIWNNETRILYGIGKHGDNSVTRANTKSPFDTLHPGRAWASSSTEGTTKEEIKAATAQHFSNTQAYQNVAEVFEKLISRLQFTL